MSGLIIHTVNKGEDWEVTWPQVEYARKGKLGLSLTNYDNTDLPAIASGSWAEVAGSIYKWEAEEAISGAPSSGYLNYIKLVPGGSGDTAYVTATWTTDAPAWSDAYQGWYDGTSRYVAGCWYDGTYYRYKFILNKAQDILRNFVFDIGDWNMDTAAQITVAHNLGGSWKNIRDVRVMIRNDDDDAYRPLESLFNNIPSGSITLIDATNITLVRAENGVFDDADHDSTSYNRGWVMLWC